MNGYGYRRIKGQDHYFGKLRKTPPREYSELIAGYKSGEVQAPVKPVMASCTERITVQQLIDQYLNFAKREHAQADGMPGNVSTKRDGLRRQHS